MEHHRNLYTILNNVDVCINTYLHPHIWQTSLTIRDNDNYFSSIKKDNSDLAYPKSLKTYIKMEQIIKDNFPTLDKILGNAIRYFEFSAAPYGYLTCILDNFKYAIESIQVTHNLGEAALFDDSYITNNISWNTFYVNVGSRLDADDKNFSKLINAIQIQPFNLFCWDLSIGVNKNLVRKNISRHFSMNQTSNGGVYKTTKSDFHKFKEDYDDVPFANLARHDYRLYLFTVLIRKYMMMGGIAIFKAFQNFSYASFQLVRILRTLFEKVTLYKNPKSKAISYEYYIICENFRNNDIIKENSNLRLFQKFNDAIVSQKIIVLMDLFKSCKKTHYAKDILKLANRDFTRIIQPI